MPKRADPLFEIPVSQKREDTVLDLLGGFVHRRPLTGEEALAQLRRQEADAKKGNPDAQVAFARHLLTDNPCAAQNRRALALLRHAAQKKRPDALHLLGVVMLRGQGLKADPEGGAALLREAALLGSGPAALDYAKACRLGVGRNASDRDALYWWRIAGAQGLTVAQREAGLALTEGRGCAVNLSEAAKWLRLAAQGRDARAEYALSRLYLRRDWEGRNPEEAEKWLREAALSGVVEAQYRLGVAYWSGRMGSVNLREALRWTCRAAENGSKEALTTLAGFFLTGNALPLNRLYAYALLRTAVRLGEPGAAVTLPALERMLRVREKREAAALIRRSDTVRGLVETLIPRDSR